MADAHPRTMEGNWGPGAEVSWPVECLLNGMNTSDHLMFNSGHNNHVIPSQFRHRFQPQSQQPMHLSAGLPLSSSINVAIPSHPMVEENGQDQEMNNGTSVVTGDVSGQDRHVVPQNHTLSSNDVLQDSDDGTEDEDEEDEVNQEMILPHRRVPIPHPHQIDENSMVPCQQQVNVRDNLGGMVPMTENHCHPKLPPSVILRNGIAANEHSLQSHLHQQHAHSMVPLFPHMDEFGQAEPQVTQGNNDPNSGYSVYGKMYFEGRIVLHLKQGNYPDPAQVGMNNENGINFSCGDSESHKSQHFQGCAACRLRSPLAPDNHRRNRDFHRHTIRGVLFTFEDCTIVELYPDQLPPSVPNLNSTGLKPNEDSNKINIPNGHSLPMNPYLAPSMVPQQESNPKQRSMQHMAIDSINVPNVNGSQPQPPVPQQHLVKPQNPDHSWWDEFDSDADAENELREAESTEEESNQGPSIRLPSCMNHKLNNANNDGANMNHLSTDHHLMHESTNDGGEDQDLRHSDEENCSQYVKYKCNICSDEFISRSQLDSHICLSHSLSQNHNGTSSSIPQAAIELDLSSSSNNSNSNNTSFENTNTADDRPVTTPTMTELENRNEISDGEQDDDCSNGLNIAITTDESYAVMKSDLSTTPKRESKIVKLKHSCANCGKTFQTKKILKSHLKECQPVQHEKHKYKCGKCNIEYEEETELQDHNCPFLYLQSPIENSRRRKLKTNKNKPEKKETCAKKRKVIVNDQTPETKRKHCKNSTKSGDYDNDADTRTNHKLVKKGTVYSKLKRANFLTSIESAPSKGRKKSQECSENRDSNSSSQENENEENSSSSNTCNYSKNSRSDDSEDESSSHEDEYEDQNELESNPQAKKLNRNTPLTSIKAIKKTQKARSNANVDGRHVKSEGMHRSKKSGRIDRSSQCEKCGKRFARKDKLMRHMYVHSEEKMFVCHICDKRFSRRDKLSDHLKSHGSDEIHHCPMCKKEFLRPDILKQHVKLHTVGNKHQCPECLRFVTGKERLEKHMARHEEARALGQTLLCPLCTKYFIQRQSLKAHIKKFHPGANLDLNIAAAMPSSPKPALTDTSVRGPGDEDQDSTSYENRPSTSTPTPESNGHKTKMESYPCRQCPKQFAKRLALKKHQRKHHHDQHLNSMQDGHENTSQNCGQDLQSPRHVMEEPCDNVPAISSAPLSHCNILLSLASQMQMVTSSPVSARSLSPTISNSTEVNPSPAHAILPTQHPPTPPLNHTSMNSVQHHHHHHSQQHNIPSMTSTGNAPPAHIPLSLSGASVSAAQSMTTQQSNILGMNGQGLHGHSSHILQHPHHSSAQGLTHPNISCSHGQLHPNLNQHLPMSPLQHMNVGMTPQFSYYHYSYQ